MGAAWAFCGDSSTAQQAVEQVRGGAEEMRARAGGRVREQIDTRSNDAAEQMRSAAVAMRRTGEQLRGEGSDGPARMADAAADRAERLGTYLQELDSDRLLRDVEGFARRQPWLTAAGGFVLGLLGARFLMASSSGRYASNGASLDRAGVYAAGRPVAPGGDSSGVVVE